MIRAIAALCLVLLALACDRAPTREGQWPISEQELGEKPREPGESTYRQYCIGCHGMDGRGNGGVTGADLTAVQGPLATKSDAELLASVRDGRRGQRATMPAHAPVLNTVQLQEVIAFVKRHYAPATPAP
jgi:mono/diheme cytochrome c family protein